MLTQTEIKTLQAQDFPGNVRELRNLLERAALLCDGDTIEVTHVQQALRSGLRASVSLPDRAPLAPAKAVAGDGAPAVPTPGVLQTVARSALQQLLAGHQGSRAELARKLGISERSLYRKIKNLNRSGQ